jgi:Zn-dependent protease
VSTPTPYPAAACRDCGQILALGALACPNCRTLVRQEEIERLVASAKQLESAGQLREARDRWMEAFLLLPGFSKQADWIKNHAGELQRKADAAQLPEQENKWASKLGPVGPIAIVLAKSKVLLAAIFKLKFLLSFAAFLGVYWTLYGPRFGLGFATLILIHEMGHFVDIKRRGLPADMPVFLPGFGAYVRWQGLGVSLATRAAISLAGPLAGLLASIGCLMIWNATGDPLWGALARASAWLNILNLIPVWVLDGGQAATAMSKIERIILLTAALGLWLFFDQPLFFLVAAGAAFRLFTKDLPPQSSRASTVYYLAVLSILGFVMWLSPGRGSGLQ